MRVFLIRHGETDGNIDPDRPSKLTDKGKKQIVKIADELEDSLDAIYSSSSERALETAKEINNKFDVELIVDDMFAEIYRVIVGGDLKEGTRTGRFEEDLDRAEDVWKEIISWNYDNIAIVTHGNLIRFLVSKAEEKDPKKYWDVNFDCASITILDIEEGIVKVVEKNKIDYLGKNLLSKGNHNVD